MNAVVETRDCESDGRGLKDVPKQLRAFLQRCFASWIIRRRGRSSWALKYFRWRKRTL
jgi:hypothetical protein